MKTTLVKKEGVIQKHSVAKSGASMAPPTYGLSFIDAKPVQKKANNTGLPDQLKSGVESLSGIDMNDVKVHYNSSQPAQLNAHAYAQGNQIHIAPGQEKHLPHEAWHVVQQKQGRVRPTKQLKGKVNVNDDVELEKEADVMGGRALNLNEPPRQFISKDKSVSSLDVSGSEIIQRFDWWSSTPLATASSLYRTPTWEGAKDIYDTRRWRLNPLNLIAGFSNYQEETAAGSNYHSSSKHGAHNTVHNASGRLLPNAALAAPNSNMQNKYTGGFVDQQPMQGRFNSEAWEAYAWWKAKQLFLAGLAPGTPMTWQAGPPAWAAPGNRSTWRVILQFPNEDVGLSMGGLGIQSVSGVMVAINYIAAMGPIAPGAPPSFIAWNGQMFPSNVPVGPALAPPLGGIMIGPAVPGGPGVVRAGHPVSAHNGSTVIILPPQGVLAKIGFRLGVS
jgi:hypothetical protein